MWSLTEQSLSISNSILRKEIQIYIGLLTAQETWKKKKKGRNKKTIQKTKHKKTALRK